MTESVDKEQSGIDNTTSNDASEKKEKDNPIESKENVEGTEDTDANDCREVDDEGENAAEEVEEQENEDEDEENAEEEEEEGEEQKEEEAEITDPYERMVKSLTNRGRNKRKVKLMENQLAHFVFAESDSEDDEDYTVGDEEMPSDDDDDDDDNAAPRKDNQDDSDDSSSDDDGGGKQLNLLDLLRSYEAGGKDDDSDDDDSDYDVNNHQNEEQGEQEDDDIGEEEEEMEVTEASEMVSQQTPTKVRPDLKGVKRDDLLRSNREYKKDVLVCGVCLESDENEGDEIVECDNCGITVHEGCYGDFDLDYDNKSVSDDLTEPWFCEPCKVDQISERICELCPTRGGVFKQTDTGKWVHLICALYTPHVGFRDVVKLQIVVLEDIKREMWGKKECAFCCDDVYSKTGVCISCDSGLCKTTFHVSCGQRNGFLSDIPDKNDKSDENGDFLFAHCKLHTMKAKLKKRKTSWLAFQARVSKFNRSSDEEEKARIDDALIHARQSYNLFRRDMIPPKQLPQEFPRLFSSCPEACMMLARKAELLEKVEVPSYSISNAVVSGRIQKHEANLSEEFVRYFFNREMQMKELQVSVDQGEPNQIHLQNRQKALMKKSESYHLRLDEVREKKTYLTKCVQDIHDMLCKLAGRTLKLPNVLKSGSDKSGNDKIEESAQLLNSIIHRCDTCKSTDNQQFLAHCGTCSRYYHMGCLDPPLSRLPRKGDKYVWQCSQCDPSSESESDTEGPICVLVTDENGVVRRKRPNKEPDKYNPEAPKDKKDKKEEDENKSSKEKKSKDEKDTPKEKKPSNKRKSAFDDETPKKRKNVKKEKSISQENVDTKVEDKSKDSGVKTENVEKAKATPTPKKKVIKEPKVSDCFVCKTIGPDPKLLVKCDECGKCYHFLTCINPPYPRNPKVNKYWAWICEECDNSDESEDDLEEPPIIEEKRVSMKPARMRGDEDEKEENTDKQSSVKKEQSKSSSKENKDIKTESNKNKEKDATKESKDNKTESSKIKEKNTTKESKDVKAESNKNKEMDATKENKDKTDSSKIKEKDKNKESKEIKTESNKGIEKDSSKENKEVRIDTKKTKEIETAKEKVKTEANESREKDSKRVLVTSEKKDSKPDSEKGMKPKEVSSKPMSDKEVKDKALNSYNVNVKKSSLSGGDKSPIKETQSMYDAVKRGVKEKSDNVSETKVKKSSSGDNSVKESCSKSMYDSVKRGTKEKNEDVSSTKTKKSSDIAEKSEVRVRKSSSSSGDKSPTEVLSMYDTVKRGHSLKSPEHPSTKGSEKKSNDSASETRVRKSSTSSGGKSPTEPLSLSMYDTVKRGVKEKNDGSVENRVRKLSTSSGDKSPNEILSPTSMYDSVKRGSKDKVGSSTEGRVRKSSTSSGDKSPTEKLSMYDTVKRGHSLKSPEHPSKDTEKKSTQKSVTKNDLIDKKYSNDESKRSHTKKLSDNENVRSTTKSSDSTSQRKDKENYNSKKTDVTKKDSDKLKTSEKDKSSSEKKKTKENKSDFDSEVFGEDY